PQKACVFAPVLPRRCDRTAIDAPSVLNRVMHRERTKVNNFERISYEMVDHVAVVTIRRPEVRNALDNHANIELGQAFDHFAQDDDAWVAIITAVGDKAFCSGNDMKARARGDQLTKEEW